MIKRRFHVTAIKTRPYKKKKTKSFFLTLFLSELNFFEKPIGQGTKYFVLMVSKWLFT